MQTYRITAPHFVAGVIVSGDYVLQSAPIVGWSVGQPFATLRDYSQRRGWIVEPMLESAQPTYLELEGRVYEIEWQDESIQRITMTDSGEEPRELTYDELPEILKEQL
jgi:hypothetical protein